MQRWLIGAAVTILLGFSALAATWAFVFKPIDVAAASAHMRLEPDPLGAASTPTAWRETSAPAFREAFQREIYGEMPDLGEARVTERRELALEALPFAHVETWRVELGETGRRFNMLVVSPPDADGPRPVIVMELFCGPRAAVPGRPEAIPAALTREFKGCEGGGWAEPIVTFILGRYINGPPFEMALRHGYALALFYPGDVVADDGELAPETLAEIGGTPRAGALAVWARLYSKAYDVVAADSRFDASRIAIWGHSRHGKAALLAGAFDHRFWAVIAHQSGRFGASPTESTRGESRAKILEHYAYWFAPDLTETSPLSVDQHVLIALNAPVPVLFGNGSGDFWSDPSGAWRAIQAADPVYEMLGSRGFDQPSAGEPDFSADLVWMQRPGGHGVTTRDWRAFLSFLDAHRDRPASPDRGGARP